MGTSCLRLATSSPAPATLLLLLLCASLLPQVDCSSVFELALLSFANAAGRDSGGACCAGARPADGRCPLACAPLRLRVCGQHYQATVLPELPCTFYEYQTASLGEDWGGGPPPLRLDLAGSPALTFELNFTWPGQFALIIEAWHTSEKTSGHGKTLVSRFIAQRSLRASREWTRDRLQSGGNGSAVELRYRVYCATHYHGPQCGAFCRPRDDTFGHYGCREDGRKLCLAGWSGDYCQNALCLKGCVNGICDGEPGQCRCRPGWEGRLCNACMRYPGCMHGTCLAPFQCNCNEGWGGLFCDQDLNYCTNHKPCRNDGTCTNTGQGSYTCNCTREYMGKNCDKLQNPCRNNPCKNGATCQSPGAGKYVCECSLGFFGPHCETSANICTHSPCENGGTCIPHPEGFTCTCPPAFTGDRCDISNLVACKKDHCLNGGICIEQADPASSYCQCPQGLRGFRCEIPSPPPCSYNVCKNGGTCTTTPDAGDTCICTSGFSGTHCQVRRHRDCTTKPCANGGACRDLPVGDYHCDCKPGYSGKDCLMKSDTCRPSPCLNGGLCHPTQRNGGFVCHCPSGYHGSRCQSKDAVLLPDWDGRPFLAANTSHHVSVEEETENQLSGQQVALIASLSTVLPLLCVFCCAVLCALRRRRHRAESHRRASDLRSKECELETEDERLQNERNTMHMNNKCNNVPQKIVNTLDRVNNDAPPKVLNVEVSNKKVPDKGLVYTPRTLQKRANLSGSTVSCHQTQDRPPGKSGGIYVIEDHFRSRLEDSASSLEDEDVLATEV